MYQAWPLSTVVQGVYSLKHPPGVNRAILKLSHTPVNLSSRCQLPSAQEKTPVWAAGQGVDGMSEGENTWMCTKIKRQHCAERSKTCSRQNIYPEAARKNENPDKEAMPRMKSGKSRVTKVNLT